MVLRAVTRWLTPTASALAITGLDLAVGGQPTIDARNLRPPGQQRDDRLSPQPLAVAALVVLLVGLSTAALRAARLRRGVAALVGFLAAVLLLASQAVAESAVEDRLTAQLAVPLPAGKAATDYVQTGSGFGLALILTVLLAVGNVVGWWRAGRRRGAVPVPLALIMDKRATFWTWRWRVCP